MAFFNYLRNMKITLAFFPDTWPTFFINVYKFYDFRTIFLCNKFHKCKWLELNATTSIY